MIAEILSSSETVNENKISHYVVKLFPRSRITTYHSFTDSAYYMKSWQLENHVRGLTWLSGCAHIKRVVNSLSQLVLVFQLSTRGTAVKSSGEELSFSETISGVCGTAGTTALHFIQDCPPPQPSRIQQLTACLAVSQHKSPAFLFFPITCPDDDLKLHKSYPHTLWSHHEKREIPQKNEEKNYCIIQPIHFRVLIQRIWRHQL